MVRQHGVKPLRGRFIRRQTIVYAFVVVLRVEAVEHPLPVRQTVIQREGIVLNIRVIRAGHVVIFNVVHRIDIVEITAIYREVGLDISPEINIINTGAGTD